MTKQTIYFALFAFLFLYNPITAQTFSQEFQNNDDLDARVFAIESHDTGYLLGITKVEATNDFRNKVKLIATDASGTIQNVKVYEAIDADYSISCTNIISLADGSQIISGIYSENNTPPYDLYMMRLNADGSVNWANKFSTNRYQPPTIKLLDDDTFFVAFDYADPFTHKVFCKMDLAGNLSNFKNCDNFISGGIVTMKAYNTSFELLLTNGNLINISNDLSTVNWQRRYFNEIGVNYNRTANGDYIFATAQVAFPGYMTVFRTDADGTLLWAKYIEVWKGTLQNQLTIFDIVGFNFIKEDSTGAIITNANSEGGLNGSLTMVLDANGNYVSNYKIESFKNITTLLDNDRYILGAFQNFGEFNMSNFIFENRNLSTTYSCDSVLNYSIADGTDMALAPDVVTLTPITFATEPISIQFTTETIAQDEYCSMLLATHKNSTINQLINVYPNPATDQIFLELTDVAATSLTLFDMNGRTLLATTTNLTQLFIGNLSKGVYLLQIATDKGTAIKKIVKN